MKVGGVTLKDIPLKYMTYITRDMQAESGDVSYTGFGFKPNWMMAMAMLIGNISFSKGFSQTIWTPNPGPSNYRGWLANPGGGATGYMNISSATFIYLDEAVGKNQQATVKSADADGFTLNWIKDGSTGVATAYIYVVAMRF